MSDGLFRRFFDNLGKIPEEKPPLIPQRWRIPVFVTTIVVALLLLLLLLWLVVLPGIRAQQGTATAPLLLRAIASTREGLA